MNGVSIVNFSAPIIDSISEKSIDPLWSTDTEILCREPGSLVTAYNLQTFQRRVLFKLPKNIQLIIWCFNKSFFDSKTNSIWMLGTDGKALGFLCQFFLD